MQRFTLPRDLYHGKGSLEALKSLEGKIEDASKLGFELGMNIRKLHLKKCVKFLVFLN